MIYEELEDFDDLYKTLEEVEEPLYPINENGMGTIPLGTTCIENESFRGCKELTSVIIPDTVWVIGVRAFASCTTLKGFVIPNSVKEIENMPSRTVVY